MNRNINPYTLLAVVIAMQCGCSKQLSGGAKAEGTGLIVWGERGGVSGADDGEFAGPGGIAFNSHNETFIADSVNKRVQVFDEDGTYLRQWQVDGSSCSLVVDGEDNVFVLVYAGFVIKYDRQGNELLRWGGFGTGPGEFRTPRGIAIDRNEQRVYVTDLNNHDVQVFSCDGRLLDRWETNSGLGDIAIDSYGYLYIAGDGRLQKLNKNGDQIRAWANMKTTGGDPVRPQGIAVDSDGCIFVSDVVRKAVYKLNPDGLPLLSWGKLGSGQGEFSRPDRVAIANDNTVYVSDSYYNSRVQRFTADGEFIQEIGKMSALCMTFSWPSSVAVSKSGTVYVCDSNHVKKFDIGGTQLNCWGGLGESPGQFFEVRGIAVYNDNVYVADARNSRIQVFDQSGILTGGWDVRGYHEGQFVFPEGIAIDEGGLVFVLGGSRVQKLDSGGMELSSFLAPSGSKGIAVDNHGGIFVTSGDHTVSKHDYDGRKLMEWGREGTGDGEFNSPRGIAVDAAGYIYVADFENSRVQKFDSRGTYVAKWGSKGSGAGKLFRPAGVACWENYVFVADSNNYRVQRVPANCWVAER